MYLPLAILAPICPTTPRSFVVLLCCKVNLSTFPNQACSAKTNHLPVSYDEKSCLVQTQVQWDIRQFQLTVQIWAWGLIQGKVHVQLKQVQELFCLRELVLSYNPRSEPESLAKMLFFLKSHLKRWLFWHFEETTNLIRVDTSWPSG